MNRLPILVLMLTFALAVSAKEQVLARNEWTTVTKADFDAEMARIPSAQHYSFLSSAERVARIVEIVLVNKTLAAQARAEKLDEDQAIKREIQNQAERVLARHRQERLEAALKVPDFTKRAGELYKANSEKYVEKALYHTAHVLVDTRCRTVEEAMARAVEARKAILAGTPFSEVAQKYSDDPSTRNNKGDLGPLALEGLAKEYAGTVRNMKKGELSEPFGTEFGVHVVRLVDSKPGRQLRFDEVRDGIVAELKEDWLKQEKKSMGDRILADPKLKLEVDAIQALKTTPQLPANAPLEPPLKPAVPGVPPAFTSPKS